HTKGKARLRPKDLNGGADPTADELTRLMLIFEGSGSWDVTTLSQTEPGKCHVTAAPASGRLKFPWVRIELYKKTQTWVPGQGAVTSYKFAPDMVAMLQTGLANMPQEKRVMVCPKAPPANISDIFGHMFHAFHNNEVVTPDGLEAEVMGGTPVFRMTGFVPGGGPEDVILSKPYFQTLDVSTENTLVDLRHTPQ
ncbi:MAG TPA: hypothetical protein VL527_12860, partial [Dongiaceae bacterium]|nr:hypothetical protein [Dongiaceae bacterium]